MRLLLITLCLLLMGLIYYQLADFQSRPHLSGQEAMPELKNKAVLNPVEELKPISAYSQIIKRPLFSLDRKPSRIKNDTAIETIDIAELEDLIIYGVVISSETKYAIVGYKGEEGDTEQIKEGRRYKGWVVTDISPESVKFQSDEGQYEIFVSKDLTSKKSEIKKPARNKPVAQAIYRSARPKNQSPLSLPIQTNVQTDIDQGEIDRLSEEGAYEYDPEEDFDDEFDR